MKYIIPSRAARYNRFTNTELGHDTIPQLYDLSADTAEKNNLADQHPALREQLMLTLDTIRNPVLSPVQK